ncbi:MAG: hypothetical protein ACTTJC_07710 [Campylobacter sp.]
MLIYSFKTILKIGNNVTLTNGHALVSQKDKNCMNEFIAIEKYYYKSDSKDYTYTNTGENSFLDLERILEIAYKNSIKMDIIFNPFHIRLWESFDYFLGYDFG